VLGQRGKRSELQGAQAQEQQVMPPFQVKVGRLTHLPAASGGGGGCFAFTPSTPAFLEQRRRRLAKKQSFYSRAMATFNFTTDASPSSIIVIG
jgi:hypothetical protein